MQAQVCRFVGGRAKICRDWLRPSSERVMLKHHRFKDIDDLYSSGRVSEARRLLMEMQAGYIAICDENAMLKMQVHEFEDILYIARNLVFDGSAYWLVTGGIKQGPFCPRCYNREGALIRLDAEENGDGKWRCATCGAIVTREYAQPALPFRRSAKVLPFDGELQNIL